MLTLEESAFVGVMEDSWSSWSAWGPGKSRGPAVVHRRAAAVPGIIRKLGRHLPTGRPKFYEPSSSGCRSISVSAALFCAKHAVSIYANAQLCTGGDRWHHTCMYICPVGVEDGCILCVTRLCLWMLDVFTIPSHRSLLLQCEMSDSFQWIQRRVGMAFD